MREELRAGRSETGRKYRQKSGNRQISRSVCYQGPAWLGPNQARIGRWTARRANLRLALGLIFCLLCSVRQLVFNAF